MPRNREQSRAERLLTLTRFPNFCFSAQSISGLPPSLYPERLRQPGAAASHIPNSGPCAQNTNADPKVRPKALTLFCKQGTQRRGSVKEKNDSIERDIHSRENDSPCSASASPEPERFYALFKPPQWPCTRKGHGYSREEGHYSNTQ